MTTLGDPRLIALHRQHTVQNDDVLTLYHLAKTEGISEDLESLNFEQVLGLSCYLFVTTRSIYTRQKLSHILPRFGSDVVGPLVRVLNHFQPSSELGKLALQSLGRISSTTLAIGLSDLLAHESPDEFKSTALQLLAELLHRSGDDVRFWVSRLVPVKYWRSLEAPCWSAAPLLDSVVAPSAGSRPKPANGFNLQYERLCV